MNRNPGLKHSWRDYKKERFIRDMRENNGVCVDSYRLFTNDPNVLFCWDRRTPVRQIGNPAVALNANSGS